MTEKERKVVVFPRTSLRDVNKPIEEIIVEHGHIRKKLSAPPSRVMWTLSLYVAAALAAGLLIVTVWSVVQSTVQTSVTQASKAK